MKLKRFADDFDVEELTEVAPSDGPYALYRLTKTGLGTIEAVAAILQRIKARRDRLSFGGLKDRYARTVQFVTIFQGPRRGLTQTNLHLEYLGQTDRPFAPTDIAGNRFKIVLRSMSEDEVRRAVDALADVVAGGVPNYFDDQRFGSVGRSGEFIARAWIAEDWDRALRLSVAEPNRHDRLPDKQDKKLLARSWGEWQSLRSAVRTPAVRLMVEHLSATPEDLRGAFARSQKDRRGLWLSAFQSHLWNRWLAALIHREAGRKAPAAVQLRLFSAPFFRDLSPQAAAVWQARTLPLPSSRATVPDSERELLDAILGEYDLVLEDMKVRFPPGDHFARGERPTCLRPVHLEWRDRADDFHVGKRLLELRFDLPRGAYATIIVKRITDTTQPTRRRP